MKHILVAAIVATAIVYPKAFAAKIEQTKEFFINGTRDIMTKREAAKRLILYKNETMYRCQEVVLNDRLSIVRKK